MLSDDERKERRREACRRYQAKNKEKLRDMAKARYWADPEKYRAAGRAWLAVHPRISAAEIRAKESAAERATRLEKERVYYRKVKPRMKEWAFQRKYGISTAEREGMILSQGGKCALCRNAFDTAKTNHIHTDHDHSTGKVRGILCSPCNTSLGKLGDNAAGLQRALVYLEGYQPGVGAGLL